MALGTFIAGRYAGSYGGQDTGMTRQGYELEVQPKEEVINESDLYGLSTIDWIERGADWFLQFESKEYKAGSLAAFLQRWGGAANMGVISTPALPLGRLASASAQPMVLTATAGTPAAATPASLTASLAQLAPGYNPKILFDSRLRHVPIRLQLLPYPSSSNTICFSTT